MTDRFDLELQRRLAGLAEAVPLDAPLPSGMVRPAIVRAGPASRGLGPGVFVPALALVLIATLAAGLARVGPFAPGVPAGSQPVQATAPETSSPTESMGQVATDQDGDFKLTLTSDKSSYRPDDPVAVTGSLVYQGPEASIELGHDSSGAIMFGVRERIYGAIDLNTVSLLMCGRTTLQRDIPLQLPFRKQGGFPGDDPAAESFKAFMFDPVLRLPGGTWHIYAVVDMTPFCAQSSPTAHLEAELTIVVR
jgi:hypothetical protein